MNRFARTGETADPCGVPFVRSLRTPSGYLSGAASHRFTCSSTQRASVTAATARTMRSHGTSSKNAWTSRSITQSYFQHRLPTCLERIVGRLARPVAIRVLVEPRLHQRLQEHGHHRLRDPISDRRHAEHSDPVTVRLWDLHCPDR